MRGDVVDWIQLPHWPVFNLADSAIVCGGVLAVLLAVRGLRMDGTVDRSGRATPPTSPAHPTTRPGSRPHRAEWQAAGDGSPVSASRAGADDAGCAGDGSSVSASWAAGCTGQTRQGDSS